MKSNQSNYFSTRRLVLLGVLSSLAFLLMFFEVPVGPFLKIDVSDIPAVIATFAAGAVGGIMVELIKNLLHYVVGASTTAGVGEIANFAIASFFIIPLGLILKRKNSIANTVIAFTVGTLFMTAAGAFLNYYIMLPFYATAFHWPLEDIIASTHEFIGAVSDLRTVVLFYITPFNIAKGILISVISFFLVKALKPVIKDLR